MTGARVTHVPVATLRPERFRELLGDAYREVEVAANRAAELFSGRVVWHVNSTARGGGVVELLQSLLGYTRGAGVDARWVVVGGPPEFFAVTKRIHNRLHGSAGDGGGLGEDERHIYEDALASERRGARRDRQTARRGLLPRPADRRAGGAPARDRGDRRVALPRGHRPSERDRPRDLGLPAPVRASTADAYVFSRRAFAWDGLDENRIWVVPPSIDAFSPKNQELAPASVEAILARTGLGPSADGAAATFERADGSPGRVDRAAEVDQDGPIPAQAPLVAQVSRWDRLKDPGGVLTGFVDHLQLPRRPSPARGPERRGGLRRPRGRGGPRRDPRAARRAPGGRRVPASTSRCLPMDDVDENAAIVNAIQRRADVVVQKSLAEGFGLTVAEAMWKARPVVASRVGGIQDQIIDGATGVLLEDPLDLVRFGAACEGLLADPARAATIGAGAREWVIDRFLGSRHLVQYLRLLDELLSEDRRGAGHDPEAAPGVASSVVAART